jgi:hypothetical protein
MVATIQYKIRVHVDVKGAGDYHPVLTINAENKEEAVAKADWAVGRMFASGELDGAGVREVIYEPEDQKDSHWTKIVRDIADIIK